MSTAKSEDCRAEAESVGGLRFTLAGTAQSYDSASQPRNGEIIMGFFYVYILQSKLNADHFYVGSTEDLNARLKTHNAGRVPHTIKFRPWRMKTAIAFTELQRATDFERYLKTASGRAFAIKRL